MIDEGRPPGSNVASIVRVKSGNQAITNNNVIRATVKDNRIYKKRAARKLRMGL